MTLSVAPTSYSFISQRTRLHYLDWGNWEAPPLILIHGGRDHARSWDWTAERLRHDWHVVAPDLRGHGDSDWSSDGAYSRPSWIYDLAQLVDHLAFPTVSIVAHSLGAMIALHYAGLYPERVVRLVSVEGSGALPAEAAAFHARPIAERWLEYNERRHGLAQPVKRYASFKDALARMRNANPQLNEEQVRHLTTHAVRRNEDGTFSWKFDPYVRSFSPFPIITEDTQALWQRIECPVLLAWGTRSYRTNPETDGTIGHFRNAETATFDGGHWLHHDCFDAFIDRTESFLARPAI